MTLLQTLRRGARHAAERIAPKALLTIRGPSARRRVALTLDDGPDELTLRYLDLLDRHRAVATFFVIGAGCAAHRDLLLETERRGHEIAGHGYTHTPFPQLRHDQLRDELDRTAALLPPARGRRRMIRPPRGAVSLRSLLASAAAGYRSVLWSLDSDDCRTRDADVVAAKVSPERVRPGEIVLLHEGQTWTLDALPRIIDGLRGAGYDLVTVGELLGDPA